MFICTYTYEHVHSCVHVHMFEQSQHYRIKGHKGGPELGSLIQGTYEKSYDYRALRVLLFIASKLW